MVMKERNLLARLHCPQLVNMHYAFQDDRHLYIVMDVCLGGDLHYQLSSSPTKSFSEDVARFYAASLVVCLSYMHGVGVIHRDIKPENLLLDSRGQLKVTDLGISQELVDGVCNSTSGTRPYMAPEIFMSGHRHTMRASRASRAPPPSALHLGLVPVLGQELGLGLGLERTRSGSAIQTSRTGTGTRTRTRTRRASLGRA
jgi:serine/threonine protein kinase